MKPALIDDLCLELTFIYIIRLTIMNTNIIHRNEIDRPNKNSKWLWNVVQMSLQRQCSI